MRLVSLQWLQKLGISQHVPEQCPSANQDTVAREQRSDFLSTVDPLASLEVMNKINQQASDPSMGY